MTATTSEDFLSKYKHTFSKLSYHQQLSLFLAFAMVLMMPVSLWLIRQSTEMRRQAFHPTTPPITNPGCNLPSDIDNDGIVDLTDYSLLKINFFRSTGQLTHLKADINQDGIVDLSDYSWLVNYFFQSCAQSSSPIGN